MRSFSLLARALQINNELIMSTVLLLILVFGTDGKHETDNVEEKDKHRITKIVKICEHIRAICECEREKTICKLC